jgi:hypothetical protein
VHEALSYSAAFASDNSDLLFTEAMVREVDEVLKRILSS